jgi:O-antigen/teichoic acid export membrane protein
MKYIVINRIKPYLSNFGIDKAILFTSGSSLIGTFGSVVTVLLVIHLLTEIEQGYYYTFGSVLSIQIFFELGFNNIITQFAAHETGKFDNDLNSQSNNHRVSFSRLSSLLNLIIRWYSFLFLILLFILTFSGIYFFSKNSPDSIGLSWRVPWVIIVVSSCLNFLVSPILAFLIGLGNIKEISKLQLIQNVIKILLLLLGLLLGFKLYAIGLSLIGAVSYISVIVYKKYKTILIDIWKIKGVYKISYYQEIFPYQWKIALSWISGYFIFQMFNPVLFATEGPKVAGQMGMTLTALSGLSTLSLSWITTKIPTFSNLIAANEINQLKILFNKTFKQSLSVNLALLIMFLITITIIKYFRIKVGEVIIGDRFIDYLPLTFMVIATLLNQISSSWALYLRCFKKEPYLINSIVGAVLVVTSTLFFGSKYGLIGITSGYLIISIICLPWAYYVFQKNKI